MPYYRETLLSAWPTHLTFTVGKPPPKIDLDILQTMTTADFGGYAKNPRRTKRNQVDCEPQDFNLPAPKFLSEKGKENNNKSGLEMEQTVTDEKGIRSLFDIPSYYKKVEIKYSRFGIDDFDFRYVAVRWFSR